MPSCRECDRALAPDDRFCAGCGAAATDEVDVIGTETPLAREERVGTGTGPVVVVIVGLLVAVGGLWAMTRSSDDRAASGSDPGASRGPRTDVSTTEGASPPPQPGIEDGSALEVNNDEAVLDASAGERGPLLDHETGLTLWAGGGRGLWRIDLDTGLVTEYDVTSFAPVHASDGRLVLADVHSNAIRSVPIDDPEARPVGLGTSIGWPVPVAPGPAPGSIWVLTGDYEHPTWRLLSLHDAEVIEEFPAGLSSFYSSATGPGVVASPDGGIYERQGRTYRRAAEGGMVAVGDRHVLISTCVQPSECPLQWLDRSTWQPLDRPIPDFDITIYSGAWLSPGGRVLLSAGSRVVRAFDVERNEPVPFVGDLWDVQQVAVSPDERYVATAGASPVIHDMDTGRTYEIDLQQRRRQPDNERVLLVPTG